MEHTHTRRARTGVVCLYFIFHFVCFQSVPSLSLSAIYRSFLCCRSSDERMAPCSRTQERWIASHTHAQTHTADVVGARRRSGGTETTVCIKPMIDHPTGEVGNQATNSSTEMKAAKRGAKTAPYLFFDDILQRSPHFSHSKPHSQNRKR